MCQHSHRHFRFLQLVLGIWVPLACLYLTIQSVSCAQIDLPLSLSSTTAGSQKIADLSVLINETLAINNKAPADFNKFTLKDDWTFDRVEYDLIEFLQDLSARYKNNATSYQDPAPVEADSQLEGKGSKLETSQPVVSSPVPLSTQSDELNKTQSCLPERVADSTSTTTTTTTSPTTTTTTTTTTSPTTTVNTTNLQTTLQVVLSNATVTTSLQTSTITVSENTNSSLKEKQSEETSSTISSTTSRLASTPTPSPNLLSTSLAANVDDHDIAESSWQYGIFDRFTRAKTTSTTTREPHLVFDSDGKLNMRNFNHEECGLRTYNVEEVQPQFFQNPFEEAEASKELNQRRQRPPPDSKYDSPADYPSGSDFEESVEGFDNYKTQPNSPSDSTDAQQQQQPTNEQHSPESEFNLASRRHWLQQQLGNTLQLLGFNATNHAASLELINQTSGGVSMNVRENMMKKSGKLGKAVPDINLLGQALTPRQDELKLEARVIGGSDARLGDSPWSVSLQALVSKPGTVGVEYRHYCGGTIISEYYVLTAAHCLDFMVGRESRLFVVIGDLNWRMNAASLHGRRFGIEKLIIHSGYKSTAFGHDIGLIKTKESMKPLKVNGKYIVNSVCLPERGVEHTGEAELVGWGLFSNRNEMADTLQVADVPILPRPLCVDLYKRRTGLIQWLIGIELITDKQVCAGTFGRGICQGDSGSALVVNEKLSATSTAATPVDKIRASKQLSKILRGPSLSSVSREQTKATIIGIVAFGGIRRCSYQSLPGVYMQTSKYMDWILPRIQE